MSDRIENLYAAIAARPAGGLAGWRAGAAIDNAHWLARAHAWHALLRGQQGSDFALYLDDSLEFSAALLGAWHAGKTIWLSADTLEASCAALRASVDGFLGQFPEELRPLQPAEADEASTAVLMGGALSADLPALVVFTSGSTGAAQAIPKKLSQLASEVETLDVLFGATAGDAAVLATVSHQHIYGLLFKVLWPLSTGRAIHALSITYPEELAAGMATGPCVLVASPAHLKRLPEHLDWRGAAGMLRTVFSSGGPLAAETALAAGRLLGSVPVEVYGSSETGGVAWRQRSGITDDAWRPFPTVAWRLGAADDTLEVRSPHLADDNWLALADRAARVGEQRFLLLGRSDRIVKIEEKRISLSAMEAALLACGMAAEVRIVLCEPGAGERQRLAAFIVPTAAGRAQLDAEGKPAFNARLRAVLAAVVDAVALPRRWRYLDQMPVNAQGKTTLAALLALLDGDEGAAARRPRLPQVRELEREPLRVLLEVSAPADLLYFDGHFDVAPILPGVVQIDWAIHYGRRYFSLPLQFKGINALKFQQVIQPETPVRLELLHDVAKGCLQFRYLSEAGQHASGRVMLGDADA
ncbi:AMP-binding protein [Duganella sp. BJB488]|uniref:AMP-binding protein n=1 Tax=unclassified Duganella TaxID=2636909 RepID=UPI000E34D1E9|nr:MULTISPECIES: AMP-binding protein [unclassified Duganella]RFP11615.1 AMP-binding protein [Duganella sp. BJB489]RFP15671.1 AMP-binding protein [Duganella sp. BJB488]RFP30618.1 AMP-binding protein [Duganella sp. BJB480]